MRFVASNRLSDHGQLLSPAQPSPASNQPGIEAIESPPGPAHREGLAVPMVAFPIFARADMDRSVPERPNLDPKPRPFPIWDRTSDPSNEYAAVILRPYVCTCKPADGSRFFD